MFWRNACIIQKPLIFKFSLLEEDLATDNKNILKEHTSKFIILTNAAWKIF